MTVISPLYLACRHYEYVMLWRGEVSLQCYGVLVVLNFVFRFPLTHTALQQNAEVASHEFAQ